MTDRSIPWYGNFVIIITNKEVPMAHIAIISAKYFHKYIVRNFADYNISISYCMIVKMYVMSHVYYIMKF